MKLSLEECRISCRECGTNDDVGWTEAGFICGECADEATIQKARDAFEARWGDVSDDRAVAQ